MSRMIGDNVISDFSGHVNIILDGVSTVDVYIKVLAIVTAYCHKN